MAKRDRSDQEGQPSDSEKSDLPRFMFPAAQGKSDETEGDNEPKQEHMK